MGRLGLASFLTASTGTYLIAMTGNFGFLAPVLAKQSPAVLSAVAHTGRFGCACFQISRHDYEHRILGESHREPAQYCSPLYG